jgi:CRP-like cAMP-binding protein
MPPRLNNCTAEPCRLDSITYYLPTRPIRVYQPKEVVYNYADLADGIYLLIAGSIEVSVRLPKKKELVTYVRTAQSLFGESGILNRPRGERAMALDRIRTMFWSTQEVNALIQKDSRLGIALLKTMADRLHSVSEHLCSVAGERVPLRVVRSLVRLARACGTKCQDGTTTLPPFSHAFIARCACTSREMVTNTLIQLRTEGCIGYTSREIRLYLDALQDRLDRD